MYTGKLRIPTNRFCFKCHHRVFHSDVKGYPYVCPHYGKNIRIIARIAMKICIALKHIRKERKTAMSILL